MTKLVELDLEFDFSDAIHAFQFDADELHGSSTAKRIDFIAEYDDCYRFIEVKDPDIPGATNPQSFLTKLNSGKLLTSLASKYRDTLFFRGLYTEHNETKPIKYIVLLSCEAIEPAMMLTKQDQLHRMIPVQHEQWSKNAAETCVLLNLQQYKSCFGQHSVRRISDGTQ